MNKTLSHIELQELKDFVEVMAKPKFLSLESIAQGNRFGDWLTAHGGEAQVYLSLIQELESLRQREEQFKKAEKRLHAVAEVISNFGFVDQDECHHQLTMHESSVPEVLRRAYLALEKIQDEISLTEEEMDKLGL